MYGDLYIIQVIENFKNKKTNRPLSNETIKNYITYFFQLSDNEDVNIINYLIKYQDNNNNINKKFKWIKEQGWIKNPQKKLNKARSLNYFIFLNQLLNNIKNIKQYLSENIFIKLEKFIKEITKENTKMLDNNTSYNELKIEWLDYLRDVDKLTKDKNTPIIDKILFNLYKSVPLRDDFGNVELVEKDYGDIIRKNFYNINTETLHIRDYKTSSKYGDKKYIMFKNLANLIKESYDMGHEYLIVNTYGQRFYENKLSKYIINISSKYFNKSIGIDDIRHSVITYFNEKKSLSDRRKLASVMLHSLNTATFRYNREKK